MASVLDCEERVSDYWFMAAAEADQELKAVLLSKWRNRLMLGQLNRNGTLCLQRCHHSGPTIRIAPSFVTAWAFATLVRAEARGGWLTENACRWFREFLYEHLRRRGQTKQASYAVLRARAGELLSECISNGPYLLNRALRRVMMSAVQVVDHSGYATRITVTAGNRALHDVTLVVRRSWEVLRARCTNMDALPNKSITSTRLFFTLVGAGAFNLLGRLRQIGRVAWFRFIFVITSPIRLVARMLLSIFPHADPPAIWGKPEVRPNSRLQGFISTTLRWLWGTW
jgi:hypothetical protein